MRRSLRSAFIRCFLACFSSLDSVFWRAAPRLSRTSLGPSASAAVVRDTLPRTPTGRPVFSDKRMRAGPAGEDEAASWAAAAAALPRCLPLRRAGSFKVEGWLSRFEYVLRTVSQSHWGSGFGTRYPGPNSAAMSLASKPLIESARSWSLPSGSLSGWCSEGVGSAAGRSVGSAACGEIKSFDRTCSSKNSSRMPSSSVLSSPTRSSSSSSSSSSGAPHSSESYWSRTFRKSDSTSPRRPSSWSVPSSG
mmetsp:Transcript_4290/g.12744  ORF Transcript_4290/g.12744 Transcript_4290/m.12744 type:complete len:249 (+) Transcript_4290:271-1017(+)